MTPPTTAPPPAIPPELSERMSKTSSDHQARHVKPGWWVRTVRDDDTRAWVYVTTWMDCVHVPTGKKFVLLHGIDPTAPTTIAEIPVWPDEPICALTKPQARTLGLTDPRRTRKASATT